MVPMRRIAFGLFVNCILALTVLWSVQVVWSDSGVSAFSGNAATAEQPQQSASQASRPAFETLRGNGAMAGYVLGHGSIVPNSESVTVAGSLKRRGRDYLIDCANGTIVFSQPVRTTESVRVSYRYYENGAASRNVTAVPSMALLATRNVGMDFTYAYRAAGAGGGFDVATYGVRTVTQLSRSARLNSLVYFSAPQQGTQRVDELALLEGRPQSKKESAESLSGRFMVHEGSFGGDKLKLSFGYQDISKGFSGFQALRDAKAAPDELLNALEKEKGLRRTDLGLAFAPSGGAQAKLGMSCVTDGSAGIDTRSLSFDSGRLKLDFNHRQIDRTFTRFQDLRETDRQQLAREKGITRTSFGLAFAHKAGLSEDQWSRLSALTLKDRTGSLSARSLRLSFGSASVSYDTRSVDRGFARMADLSADEQATMLAAIYRQFDPNATAASVTDADRARIAQEAGLNRTNLAFNLATGKDAKLLVQSVSISDENGGISRRALSYSDKNLHFYALTQDIDKRFGRLASLAAVEKLHFGNEYGMRRLSFGGGYKSGSFQTEFASSTVSDGSASMTRRSLNLLGKGFDVRANFTDIDSSFARISDLADADRAALAEYRGYKKTDVTGAFKLGKSIALDAFYMTANNASEHRDRNRLRTNLTYSFANGARIGFFRDAYSFRSDKGNIASYRRQIISAESSFLGKLGLMSFSQDVCEKQDLDGTPITAVVQKRRLATDQKRRLCLLYDYKGQDFGTGKFENLTDFTLGYKLGARLGFKSILHAVDRGDDPSEVTRTNLLQWEIGKGLNFSAEMTDRTTNTHTDGGLTRLSLTGPLASRLGPFTDVKIAAAYTGVGGNGIKQADGTLPKANQSFKFEAGLLKGSFAAEYASVGKSPRDRLATSGISFSSDRDPKLPYHFNFAHKSRELASGRRIAIRNYGLDCRLGSGTSLTYSRRDYTERPDGMIDATAVEDLKLTSKLGKDWNLVYGVKRQENLALRQGTCLTDLAITGKMSGGAAVEMGFGINRTLDPKTPRRGNTLRLKYDRQVSADNFLILDFQCTKWSGVLRPGQFGTDILARIDFKCVFSL